MIEGAIICGILLNAVFNFLIHLKLADISLELRKINIKIEKIREKIEE